MAEWSFRVLPVTGRVLWLYSDSLIFLVQVCEEPSCSACPRTRVSAWTPALLQCVRWFIIFSTRLMYRASQCSSVVYSALRGGNCCHMGSGCLKWRQFHFPGWVSAQITSSTISDECCKDSCFHAVCPEL